MKIPDELQRRYEAVERNDPDEAAAIMQALAVAIGYCPAAMAHYLFMLQDDDDGLRKLVAGLDIRPEPTHAEVR